MNIAHSDILNTLRRESYISQRILAESSCHSLGVVNQSVKELINDGYLDDTIHLTQKAKIEFAKKKPQRAVILAAGVGICMMPINTITPKGLIEVDGEPLIEKIINQLHEVGIREIYIVVGFLKEHYEYLIDEYDLELIVNPDYSVKNNLHSLLRAADHLENAYIIPCDIWCEQNPFNRYELYSWYMVSDLVEDDSWVRVNRKMELVRASEKTSGNAMIGIAYLLADEAAKVRERLSSLSKDKNYDRAFWEITLFEKEKMFVYARVVQSSRVADINTYEQLRDLDSSSSHLKSEVISVIKKTFDAKEDEITEITILKKGMTNRSFLFECKGKKYIMRIPGEGTDLLINRRQEADVYNIVNNRGISDDVKYIDSDTGYKITEYWETARACDPMNADDLRACMLKLREFHNLGIRVGHDFDIFGQIEFYETMWGDTPSVYKDYLLTKERVFSLRRFIEKNVDKKVLTHIDAVPDNFIFIINSKYEKEIRLIDWEYAGMQDPHVDIAMFCIYSLYNKRQTDRLIDIYFENDCPYATRIKIYAYIATCGLLWSNWCEYKRMCGVEFGEYSIRQYRYAKDFFNIFQKEAGSELHE